MADETAEGTGGPSAPTPADWDARRQARRTQGRVDGVVAVGVLLSVVGFVLGVVMMARRWALSCPDGTAFPADGTDLQCFTQPTVPEGIAVAVISVLLGFVIALVGILVTDSVGARARAGSR